MSKLLKLICMVSILMMLTGCSDDPEPEPQPIQETWQMTYDDYHSIIPTLTDIEQEKYKNLTQNVTVLKDGDVISIKGLFAEYPDAYVKGTVKGVNVLMDNTQAIATDNDETVYFHWGYADTSWDYDYS